MVVPLATCVVFPLAEVAVPRALFATILRRIDRLRGPPLPAAWREGYGARADA